MRLPLSPIALLLPMVVATSWAQDSVQTAALADAATDTITVPIAPTQIWQLHKGLPVHSQLQSWAERSCWTLVWQHKTSWLVAGDVEFEGDFEEALKAVIEGLFFEGKPIRLVLWQGNRLAEVIPNDVR